MSNPNLPPRPGIPEVPKWLIIIPGVIIVIAGIIYFYGKLKPGIRDKEPCVDCAPKPITKNSCFIRGYSSGECEGLVVRGGDGEFFYVTGTYTADFRMKNTATLVSKGGLDAFIAKVSNEGEVIWLQSIGGTGEDIPTDIAVDTQGNPLISINYTNNANIGNTVVQGVNGISSGLMAKLNKTNGQLLWYVSAVAQGNNQKATINDIDVNNNGNILIAGTTAKTPVRFSSASGSAVILQSNSSGAYICEYNTNGNVNQVRKFAEGDIFDTHLCDDKNSERILVNFNFNDQISLSGSKFGNNPSKKNIGYAFILPNGSLVQNSCYVNNSSNNSVNGSDQYIGTIVQNQNNQFYIAGHYERVVQFGDIVAKDTQINAMVLSVNPTSYKTVDLLNISGTISRMRDVSIGNKQQVLFGSSYILKLITKNAKGQVEISFQTAYQSPGNPSNAFIANYTSDFQKNWVHRCVSKKYDSGNSGTLSVGSNINKIAFTGHVVDTISCDENLPLVMDTFNHRKDFLMKIVDY